LVIAGDKQECAARHGYELVVFGNVTLHQNKSVHQRTLHVDLRRLTAMLCTNCNGSLFVCHNAARTLVYLKLLGAMMHIRKFDWVWAVRIEVYWRTGVWLHVNLRTDKGSF